MKKKLWAAAAAAGITLSAAVGLLDKSDLRLSDMWYQEPQASYGLSLIHI